MVIFCFWHPSPAILPYVSAPLGDALPKKLSFGEGRGAGSAEFGPVIQAALLEDEGHRRQVSRLALCRGPYRRCGGGYGDRCRLCREVGLFLVTSREFSMQYVLRTFCDHL